MASPRKIDIALAAKMYRGGINMPEIAERLGVSMSGISAAFIRHGVPRRTIRESQNLTERVKKAALKRAEVARQAANIAADKDAAKAARPIVVPQPKPTVRRVHPGYVRIPAWVPDNLRQEYFDLMRLYGEHTAASEIRAMKAAQ